MRALVLAIGLALTLAGCATPQTDALRGPLAYRHLGLRAAHEIAGVPFIAQERAQCGPATLAMALGAAGAPADPAALRDMVFVPGRAGSFSAEMLAAARRQGHLAVTLEPSLDAVLREVDGGTPVIVLQNLGLAIYPVWHYALVIGYDLDDDRVVLHSGPQQHVSMSLELFERTWARADHWAMVAVPPWALPVTPSSDTLLDAAAALERVAPAAARLSYAALLQRAAETPDARFAAWMGLGNSAFAGGDAQAAAGAFEQALQLHDGNADAWNNLASARAALGERAAAQAAIARALALGGPHQAIYQQTAAEIARAPR